MATTGDIGAEAARLPTAPAWIGKRVIERVIELGSMVGPGELTVQSGAVLQGRSHQHRGVAG